MVDPGVQGPRRGADMKKANVGMAQDKRSQGPSDPLSSRKQRQPYWPTRMSPQLEAGWPGSLGFWGWLGPMYWRGTWVGVVIRSVLR